MNTLKRLLAPKHRFMTLVMATMCLGYVHQEDVFFSAVTLLGVILAESNYVLLTLREELAKLTPAIDSTED
jgi:hypothetical protein